MASLFKWTGTLLAITVFMELVAWFLRSFPPTAYTFHFPHDGLAISVLVLAWVVGWICLARSRPGGHKSGDGEK